MRVCNAAQPSIPKWSTAITHNWPAKPHGADTVNSDLALCLSTRLPALPYYLPSTIRTELAMLIPAREMVTHALVLATASKQMKINNSNQRTDRKLQHRRKKPHMERKQRATPRVKLAMSRAVSQRPSSAPSGMLVSRGRVMPHAPKEEGFVTKHLRSAGHSVVDSLSSMVGGAADSFLSKFLGVGAYTVKANSLMDVSAGSMPAFGQVEYMDVVRQEYLGDVTGSVAFRATSYPLNPGVATTFPWEAAIAANFEQWCPMGIVFELRTLSGTAISGSNPGLGVWGMCTNYDASAPDPRDKREAETMMYTSSSVPYQSIVHPIECDPTMGVTDAPYVRTATQTVPADTDIRLYDWGRTTVFTQGQQVDGATIGELWVSSKIRLFKPVLSTNSLFRYSGWSFRSANGNSTYTTPTLYSFSPGHNVNVINFTNRPYVTFGPGTKGFFSVEFTTFAILDATGTGYTTHGAANPPANELNLAGEVGVIRYFTYAEMAGMYGGNWVYAGVNAEGGAGMSCTTLDQGTSTTSNPSTTVYVYVDNTGSTAATSSIRMPLVNLAGLATSGGIAGSFLWVESINLGGVPSPPIRVGTPTARADMMKRGRIPISLNPHLSRFSDAKGAPRAALQVTDSESEEEDHKPLSRPTPSGKMPGESVSTTSSNVPVRPQPPDLATVLRPLGFTQNVQGEWVNIDSSPRP